MSITLEDLKKLADEKRQELAELEGAIKVWERLGAVSLGGKHSPDVGNAPILGDTGTIDIDALSLPKKVIKPKTTLLDNVKNVIERFENQEFTVGHVDAALKAMGKGSTAKHFRNRVSVLVRKLHEDGILTRTFKGKGSEPHKYRRKQPVSLVKSAD